jgi:hypothetical protein
VAVRVPLDEDLRFSVRWGPAADVRGFSEALGEVS